MSLQHRTDSDRLDELLEAAETGRMSAGANASRIVAAVDDLKEEVIRARNVGRDLRAMFAILLTFSTIVVLVWVWQAVVSGMKQAETNYPSSR